MYVYIYIAIIMSKSESFRTARKRGKNKWLDIRRNFRERIDDEIEIF